MVDRLAKEVRDALKLPDVRERITGMGFEIQDNGTPEGFVTAYRQELPVWYRLIKASGAKLD